MLMQRTLMVATLFGLFTLAACAPIDDEQSFAETTPDALGVGHADMPVIGGSTDRADPSIVAIFARKAQSSYGSLCTGTVISPWSILTAAHCVDPAAVGKDSSFEVYQGTVLGEDPHVLRVASVDFDPEFAIDKVQNGHDIAVITLTQPTTLPPIHVNQRELNAANLQSPVRVVGYGANSHGDTGAGTKRSVTTRIASVNSLFVKIGTSTQQSCHGDSGGPALQVIDGVESIIGVTSFGLDRSASNVCFGGGYDTRVDTYSEFVNGYL